MDNWRNLMFWDQQPTMTDETSQVIKDDKVLTKMQSEFDALKDQCEAWKQVASYLYDECRNYIDKLYGPDATVKKYQLSEDSGYFRTLLFGIKKEESDNGN